VRLSAADVGCWVLKSTSPPADVVPGWQPGTAQTLTRCVRRSYRLDLMVAGQPCLLWLSGRTAPGVHALGELTGGAEPGDDGWAVRLRLTLLPEPVARAELLIDPVARGGGGIAHACRQQSVVALPRPVRRRPRPGRRKPPGIMECVTPNRLRAGACAWLLTLQFFVVETIAQLRYTGPYSRMDDAISDLGASPSPAAQLMNASFVLQAALILAGALLLRPALRGTSGRVAPALLELAAAGVLLVGVFPSDGHAALHATGAILHLLGGGLGLIALAYSLRPRSEAVGTTLALLGLIGTAMTLFFIAGVTQYLGDGGTERAAAYVVPIGLAVAGAALWRLSSPPPPSSDGPPTMREEQARARAERAERDRERDQALEAAAGRRTDAANAPESVSDDSDDDRAAAEFPPDDEDDPWTTPRRGRAD